MPEKLKHALRRTFTGAWWVDEAATCGGPKKCQHCRGQLEKCTRQASVHRTEEAEALGASWLERLFGDWSPGCFAWRLQVLCKLPAALPAVGKQMLWEWEPPGCLDYLLRQGPPAAQREASE